MDFNLPASINTNHSDIEFLLKRFHFTLNSSDDEILLDFRKVQWMSGELTVVLGIIIETLREEGKKIRVITNSNKVSSLIKKNGFFKMYELENALEDKYNSAIPYKKIQSEAYRSIESYVNDDVFPKIKAHMDSDDLDILLEAVFELLVNVRDHAGSDNLYMCGQYFPNKSKIELSFADVGVTIPKKVKLKYNSNKDSELIHWATEKGNSTKAISSSGLGLYEIKKNIEGIGKLSIISNKGYYTYEGEGSDYFYEMSHPFPGTLINLTFFMTNHYMRNSKLIEEFFAIDF